MLNTMNICLPPELEEIVRKKLESGRYNSASEVISEALQLLDRYDSTSAPALMKLRADVEAGWRDVEHGRLSDFDPEEIKRRGRERLGRTK
jgi:antitoxin ParD1/3/4